MARDRATDAAERVQMQGKQADYEQNAIDAVERSWLLEDRECQALALQDAQVWATLRLAQNMERLADLTEGV